MEVKYRVWDHEQKEWCGANVYAVLPNGDFITAMFDKSGSLTVPTRYSKDIDGKRRFEVCLNTTLVDKDGKEIFEGDVLGWEHPEGNERYKVHFEGCAFRAQSIKNPEFGGGNDPLSDPDDFRVIGNIYENPDLIDGERKE